MKLSKRSVWSSTFVALALSAATAHAMDDDVGTECGTCQFPTAVTIGLCSGVYVGQGLVLTAAHCTDDVNEGTTRAYFGEDQNEAASAVVDHCVRHPDGEPDETVFGGESYDGVDLAFCILQDADQLPDVPIVPPMVPTGCERDWLAHRVYASGTPPVVTAVGSGCADYYNGGTYCADGVKRYVALQLVAQTSYNGSSTKLEVERWGDIHTGMMDGDSGGPLFEALPDGTWRLLGVHHGTNAALSAAFFEAVPPFVHWIELESGIDITPCHELVDGEWQVAGSCAGELPLDTNEAGGSWAAACPSALGGGTVGLNGICSGWPVTPDSYAVEPASGAVLHADLFLTAASGFVEKPARRRGKAADKLATRLLKQAVFPFLEPELPQSIALAALLDPQAQEGVRLMMREAGR
jgi:hypothetical protein